MRRILTRFPVLLAAAGALAAAPSRASAQRMEPVREGWWGGGALGWGSVGTGKEMRSGGLAGTIRMGFAVSREVLLGGEGVWFYSTTSESQPLGVLSAVVYWYPSPTGILFFQGGVGYYHFSRSGYAVYWTNPPTPGPRVSSTGFGLNVGAGVDLYAGRSFSVTPFVNLFSGITEKIITSNLYGMSMQPALFQVGVSAVWH